MQSALPQVAEKAKNEFGAEVIVLSDAGMGVSANEVTKAVRLPVLEGITSAIIRIEYMVFQQADLD